MAKTKTITIKVTTKDILLGERKNCFKCPVSLALARAAKNISTQTKVVIVDGFDATVLTNQGTTWEASVSGKVSAFITNFDRLGRAGVKPFTAQLTFTRLK